MINGIQSQEYSVNRVIEYQYRVSGAGQTPAKVTEALQVNPNEDLHVSELQTTEVTKNPIRIHIQKMVGNDGYASAYNAQFRSYLQKNAPGTLMPEAEPSRFISKAAPRTADLPASAGVQSVTVAPENQTYTPMQNVNSTNLANNISANYTGSNTTTTSNINFSTGQVNWPQPNVDGATMRLLQGDMSQVMGASPEQLKEMIAKLQSMKVNLGENVKQLENMVGTLTEHLHQLESEKNQLEQTRGEQVKQFQQEQANYQKLTNTKSMLTQEAQQLQQQKMALEGQVTSLEASVQTLTASIASMKAEAAALSANPLTAAAGATMLTQVAALEAQLAAMKAQLAQAKVQLQQTKVAIQNNQLKQKQTDQAIAQSYQKLQQISGAIQQTDQKLLAVNQQIAVISQKINEGLNMIVERRTEMAMSDVRANNLNSYSQLYGSFGGGNSVYGSNGLMNGQHYNKPTDYNGFRDRSRIGGGTANLINTVSGIASLFGFGGTSGGGLFGLF